MDNGLYIGALYNTQRAKQRLDGAQSSYKNKVKGYEFVVGYTFDNGVGVFTGYNFSDAKVVDPEADPARSDSAIYRRVPVYVNYAINDNFNIWGEAEFDANSTTEKDGKAQAGETGTMLSAGARYTF